mgnify:CR=1 FL=1
MIFGDLVGLFDIGDNDLITFEAEKSGEKVSVAKKKGIDLYGAKVSKIKPYSDTVYRKPIVFVVPDIWVKCFKDTYCSCKRNVVCE